MPHLFEFMDQEWLPESLRVTLREILECGNSRPFRGYYDWVAEEVRKQLATGDYDRVVELGAGTAPITKRLAATVTDPNIELWCSDRYPDEQAFAELKRKYGDRVVTHRAEYDFIEPVAWPPRTLLCLSATLHHVPAAQRAAVVKTLVESAGAMLVFEPLRRNIASCLFAFGSLVPGLCLPLTPAVTFKDRLRRAALCWLVPVVPIMFVWDGVVSSIRMWLESDWADATRAAGDQRVSQEIQTTTFCQAVELRAVRPAKDSLAARDERQQGRVPVT